MKRRIQRLVPAVSLSLLIATVAWAQPTGKPPEQ